MYYAILKIAQVLSKITHGKEIMLRGKTLRPYHLPHLVYFDPSTVRPDLRGRKNLDPMVRFRSGVIVALMCLYYRDDVTVLL